MDILHTTIVESCNLTTETRIITLLTALYTVIYQLLMRIPLLDFALISIAGLNRPISYGSQRRTGLMGTHVVKLDPEHKRLSPTGAWVRLD